MYTSPPCSLEVGAGAIEFLSVLHSSTGCLRFPSVTHRGVAVVPPSDACHRTTGEESLLARCYTVFCRVVGSMREAKSIKEKRAGTSLGILLTDGSDDGEDSCGGRGPPANDINVIGVQRRYGIQHKRCWRGGVTTGCVVYCAHGLNTRPGFAHALQSGVW